MIQPLSIWLKEKGKRIKSFKRIDLTPTKQGYTPERHPPKKQKVGRTEITSDIKGGKIESKCNPLKS